MFIPPGKGLSFEVRSAGRITARPDIAVTIDGSRVSVPAEGIAVRLGQRVGWSSPPGLTRNADELFFHFE